MTRRSAQRMQALGDILADGLSYSWFQVQTIDYDKVEASLLVDTGDVDDSGEPVYKQVEINADDIARGLRMYREYLEGRREQFPGDWKYMAEHAIRAGQIGKAEDFKPEVHARADEKAYGWQTVKFDQTNGEDGDYDANTADSVMQFATLGQVMFG